MLTVAITSLAIVSFLIMFYRTIKSKPPQKEPDLLKDYYMDMATPPSESEVWVIPDSKRITDGFGALSNTELFTYIEKITEGTLMEADGAFITIALLELQVRGIDFE